MMTKFYCSRCKKIFSAEGKKKEWQSSIYGKCWKLVAKCPVCGLECGEYRKTSFSSKKFSKPDYSSLNCACGSCQRNK